MSRLQILDLSSQCSKKIIEIIIILRWMIEVHVNLSSIDINNSISRPTFFVI